MKVREFFLAFAIYKSIFYIGSRELMSNSAVLDTPTDINQVCLISSESNQYLKTIIYNTAITFLSCDYLRPGVLIKSLQTNFHLSLQFNADYVR